MDDAEAWWVVIVGVIGIVAFVAGAVVGAPPPVDATDDEVATVLVNRRTPILAGALLSVTGAALLLWPLSAVATRSPGEGWASLGLFSVAVWVLGLGTLVLASILVAAVAWRDPTALTPASLRLVLDAAHLATWSVSAPVGAVAVVATTLVGVQAETMGPVVVVLAAAKVITVAVELAGTGRRSGWNAGGWAAGSSGYVTVAWLAAVVASLA